MTEKKTILYIDDEEILRLLISELLRDEGFDVKTLASFAEVQSLAATKGFTDFDAVITDFSLHSFDAKPSFKNSQTGLDVLSLVRETMPDMLVLLFSGDTSHLSQIECDKFSYILQSKQKLSAIGSEIPSVLKQLFAKKMPASCERPKHCDESDFGALRM